jgi:3-hydroxyacyl-[acyl-carrier-protein] dehydratase
MRWFWIDRFTDFVAGQHATAVKNVTLSDEPVDEYAPGATCYPSSLIVEGFAQMGGLLIGQLGDFRQRVLLGKVNDARFFFDARPGDRLEMRVDLVSQQEGGGVVAGKAAVDGVPQSEVELMFVFLNQERFQHRELFEPAAFCRFIRLTRLFEVGRNPDGSRIAVPEHFLDAERALGILV